MFAIGKLAIVFAVLVLLIRLRVHIGWAFLFASLSCGILFFMSPISIIKTFARTVVCEGTLELVAVVVLAIMLSNFLEKTGELARLVDLMRHVFRNPRLALVAPPGLIGFIPMPGGALFSAPMVRGLSTTLNLPPEHQTLVNYWFRHVWEYIWPMYPGIVLFSQLSGLHLDSIILLQLPLTLGAILSGYVFILRKVPAGKTSRSDHHLWERQPANSEPARPHFPSCLERWNLIFFSLLRVSPLLLMLGIYVVIGRGFEVPFPLPIALATGLVLTIVLVYGANCLSGMMSNELRPPRFSVKHLLSKQVPLIALMAVGVKVFAGILEKSSAVVEVNAALSTSGLPFVVVLIALPFIVGLLTGLTMGFIGATFPLLLSFDFVQQELVASLVLAFAAGFAGVMISPMHLCLVLSNQYFGSRQATVMKSLFPPVVSTLALSLILFVLYSTRL